MKSLKQKIINAWYSLVTPWYDMTMSSLEDGRRVLIDELSIKEGDSVIESGAGTGLNFQYYPLGGSYTATDINHKMLARAEKRIRRLGRNDIICQQEDATNLSFSDDSFDVGILNYAFSAIPNNEGVLSEMERVIKPGGRIGILDMSKSPNLPFGGHVSMNLMDLVEKRTNSKVILKIDDLLEIGADMPIIGPYIDQKVYILKVH